MVFKAPKPRIRWWNIFSLLLLLLGVASFVAPLVWRDLTKDFWGNVTSEIWGICFGAIVAYVFYQQFRHERFKTLMRYSSYDHPFRELRKLSEPLVEVCLRDEPDAARSALTMEIRREFRKLADQVLLKVSFYERFMELEELREIELCYGSAKQLEELDSSLSDAAFMNPFVHNVLVIYIKTGIIADLHFNEQACDRLEEISDKWLKECIFNRQQNEDESPITS